MTFIVKPIDDDGIHENSKVPRVPASINIIAPKKGGKSTLVWNLLNDKSALKGRFTEIFIFSPTCFIDKKYLKLCEEPILKRKAPLVKDKMNHLNEDSLKITKQHLISDIDKMLPKLREIYRQQDPETRDMEAMPWEIDNIAIVLDDLVGTKVIRNKFLDAYVTRSRHMKTTFIICVQLYKSLSTTLRNNASYLCIFETFSKRELLSIFEEAGGRFSFDEFLTLCNDIFSKNHTILCVNMQNDNRHRYIDNFQWYIVRKDDT